MSKYRFEQIVFNSTKKKKPTEEDKYTYLGLEHLDPGSLHVTRFGSDVAPIGEKLIMTEGDVLFGKRRAYQKKVAIAPFDGIFSAHGMVLRPNEEVIDKSFFPLFISSDYFLDAAIKISVGSLSPTINWRDLKKLEFELPEMEEQRDLAKVLWAMDATKNSYQKLLLKTDELVKSRFVEMFGGLNREPLSKYIEQVRGVSYKPADLRTSAEDDAYTLLRANNIADGTVNFDEVQYVASRKVSAVQVICKGDILMCGSSGSLGHVGKAALCKPESYGMTFGAFCKVIRPAGGLLPVYIASYFQSDEYRKSVMQLASGSNINNLKAEHIDNLLIPVASSEMQEQFAEFVYQSDKSKFQLEQALAELTSTYKKIISKKLG